MSPPKCESDDKVYHVLLKECVPKSSSAGKILSNPENKRCKDDKVINPKTNRCVDPKGPTMRPLLMMGQKQDDDKKKPSGSSPRQMDKILTEKGMDLKGKKYSKSNNPLMNAVLAVYRIHKAWASGALKTDVQVKKAANDFEQLQKYVAGPAHPKHSQGVLKAMSNIQRIEYEDARVASEHDFETVMRSLMERLDNATKSNESLMNTVLAVRRIHKAWASGALKTDVQVKKAAKDFEQVQKYVAAPVHPKHSQDVLKALSNIQRIEYEDASVASEHDFETVMRSLIERLDKPAKSSSLAQARAPKADARHTSKTKKENTIHRLDNKLHVSRWADDTEENYTKNLADSISRIFETKKN